MEIAPEIIKDWFRPSVGDDEDRYKYAKIISDWLNRSPFFSDEHREVFLRNPWLITLYELGLLANRDKVMEIRRAANSMPA